MQQAKQGPFPRPPICLALILAQEVACNLDTGLLTIVGPYSTLNVEKCPIELITIQAYAALTACDGDVMVELQMVDVNQVRPLVFRHLVSASFEGPQDVQEIIFHQYNVAIPVADEYRFLLTVYRPDFTYPEFITERRLTIRTLT